MDKRIVSYISSKHKYHIASKEFYFTCLSQNSKRACSNPNFACAAPQHSPLWTKIRLINTPQHDAPPQLTHTSALSVCPSVCCTSTNTLNLPNCFANCLPDCLVNCHPTASKSSLPVTSSTASPIQSPCHPKHALTSSPCCLWQLVSLCPPLCMAKQSGHSLCFC